MQGQAEGTQEGVALWGSSKWQLPKPGTRPHKEEPAPELGHALGSCTQDPPQSTRTQGHRQPRGRLRSESRFIPLDLTPVSPFFLLMLLLMACSWHERSLEAISRCGRKPRAAVIHPAAGGGRRGEQAAAAMVSGQIGEAQGGPQSPWQAPHPALGRGQWHEATPSHGNGPAHTKHPRLILVPRKAALAVPTVASARKGNGWGEQSEGKASPGPRNPGWGGPCRRLPAPQTPPCFRGRSPCLIPQPQMIPLSPPEHHAARPCPAAARRIPQLLAFLPRSHPRHLQSIARSLKIRCPPQCLNIKPSSSRGCCEVGPTLPPQEGHRPAQSCAQRGAQPPHAPRAPSPWPCPGPELSHGWLRAEASRRGLSPPSPCASPVSNAAPPWLRHLLI